MASQAVLERRREARTHIIPLTTDDILLGNIPDRFHWNEPGREGTCREWRENGAMKTWKTRPTEFRIPVKYGLRDYGYITQTNIGQFHDAETCPIKNIY